MVDTFAGIVSYGNPQLTVQAVECLLNQDVDLHVYVWDNFYSDEARSYLKASLPDTKQLTVAYADRNWLWAPAINRVFSFNGSGGAQFRERYKYFMFMNNDIFLPPYAVRSLREIASDPTVGCVAPWGSSLGGRQDFVSHCTVPAGADIYEYIKNRPPRRVSYVVGACVMMRTSVFGEVGGLDEEMPLGADDHDLCLKLKHNGYQIMVAENVYVEHVGHASGNFSSWSEWGQKSWDRFNEKWAGYMPTEAEAIGHHWAGDFNPDFEKATGWSEDEYKERVNTDKRYFGV